MFLIDLTIIIDPVEFIFSYKHAILKVDGVTRAPESCSYLKAVKHRYMHRFASLDSKSIRQAKQIMHHSFYVVIMLGLRASGSMSEMPRYEHFFQ